MPKRIFFRRRRRAAGDYEIVQRHVDDTKAIPPTVAQPMKPKHAYLPEKP